MKHTTLALAAMAACLPLAQAALAQQAEADPSAIESIVVQGQFLNNGAQSAMKGDVPVIDTPFSVSSYSDSFMKAIETSSVASMYNYMTGVKRAGTTGYDITIRGFKSGVNDRSVIMVDGLPGLSGRLSSPPTIGVDHIELVKGPMSVLYGQSQPGGFINIIAKKPQGQRALEFDGRLTTFAGAGLDVGKKNGVDLAMDATGPVDAEGKFLYRFIAQAVDTDGFRNSTYEKPIYLVPSVTWNLTDSTAATLSYEYRRSTFAYDTQLAVPNKDIGQAPDIKTRYQEPDDRQIEHGKTWIFNLNHKFSNGAAFYVGARSVRHDDNYHGYETDTQFRNGLIQRRVRNQYNTRSYDFADTNLNLPFETFGLKHKAVVGMNGGQEIADQDRRQFLLLGTQYDLDPYNPAVGVAPPQESFPAFTGAITNLFHRNTSSNTVGFYASDLISLGEQWKLSLGIRRAKDRQTITELRAGTPTQFKNSAKTLPLAGLLYQPTKTVTLYTSYSTSYVPAATTAFDVNGQNPFKPESAKQTEVGAKFDELMDGRVNLTTALFDIKKSNTLNTRPCALGNCSEQVGAERSKGFELEINARPIKPWQLTAGYAYTDAKVDSSLNTYVIGARLPNVARNAANIWSRYDFLSGPLSGLGVGVGLVYTSDRMAALPTAATGAGVQVLKLPAYTTADLGIYYEVERYAFTFKVTNLFDERYYESAGQVPELQVSPGAPRTLSLSMRAHF